VKLANGSVSSNIGHAHRVKYKCVALGIFEMREFPLFVWCFHLRKWILLLFFFLVFVIGVHCRAKKELMFQYTMCMIYIINSPSVNS